MESLSADMKPWLPIANQVMAGDYDKADLSMLRSLEIGLRSIPDSVCRVATLRVRQLQVKTIKRKKKKQ